jgi:integrase
MPLTIKHIRELISRGERGRWLDGRGMSLQISDTGAASWVFRFTAPGGKERFLGIGGPAVAERKFADDVTLEDARERADEARKLLRSGIDPVEARRAARNKSGDNVTFAEAAEAFYERNKVRWSKKQQHQFISSVKAYCKPIAKKPVASIGLADVLGVLRKDNFWEKKNETATRVRQRIEAVIAFATVEGWRPEGIPNTARWSGNLEHALAHPSDIQKEQHFAALPYEQLPGFIIDLRKIDTMEARALELTILTSTRTSEVLKAKRSEFDLGENPIWTIPAARTKTRKELRIPLPPRAVEIVKALISNGSISEYLFPGKKRKKVPRPLSSDSMLKVLKILKRTDAQGRPITVHGTARSSFTDWANDSGKYLPEVIEMAVGHAIKNKTTAAYRRGDAIDLRRVLINDWAAFLNGEKFESGNVVDFNEHAKKRGEKIKHDDEAADADLMIAAYRRWAAANPEEAANELRKVREQREQNDANENA